MAGTTDLELSSILRIGDLRLTLTADFETGPNPRRVFKAQLGDLTLGAIITYLVHLAEPDFDIELDPPWNALFDINLRNLVLEIDLTNSRIGFQYTGLRVDLPFLSLKQVEVWYSLPSRGASVGKSVDLALFGKLLDQDYSQKPLSWDLLRQPPPPATGLGSQIFDLEYLGLGQHVTLRDTSKLTTLGSIISALEAAHKPLDPAANPLKQLTALTFSRSSEWLIGARFSVLKTVALSVIFNDPNLYGLRISLSGERARSLGGLSFEILYRKVTDSIGVYHIDLQLPDALREMEFGEASVTLPIITVDIYTNGNFLVDFGFPHNLDFSRSATVEVIILFVPVLGAGGFYFGLLDSQTATQVPRITNGVFKPVIVAGFGLQIGLGKTIEKGILRAGALIAIEGVLEGVLAFFEPYAPDAAKEIYFKVAGSIAIVGHLFGTIDFVVVKASLDVYVYASAQFVYESHEPAIITLEAGVSISLSVSIGWGIFSFTLHFSFSAHIRESFTIGSHSQAAWQLAAPGSLSTLAATPAAVRSSAVFAAVAQAGMRWDQASAPAATLLGDTPDLDEIELIFYPQLTAGRANDLPLTAGEQDPGSGSVAQLVGLLFIASATPNQPTIAGTAGSGAAHAGQMLLGGGISGAAAPALTAFEKLARATLRWAIDTIHAAKIQAAGVQSNGVVSADDLRFIYSDLTSAQTPITAATVGTFLRTYFKQFVIAPPPADSAGLPDTFTVFPMLPFLTMTPDGGAPVNFAQDHPCGDDYRQFIAAYFAQLSAEASASEIAQNPQAMLLGDQPPETIAAVVMADYVGLIARQVVQEALDLFESYSYTANADDTLSAIASTFGLTAADAVASIARANQSSTSFYQAGTTVGIHGLVGQVRKDESLGDFAGRFDLRALDAALAIQDLPGALRPGATIQVAGARYTTQMGDTLTSIAAHFFTTSAAILSFNPGVDWAPADPAESLRVGVTISLPTIAYVVSAGDTLRGVYIVGDRDTLRAIATRFATTVGALLAANPSIDGAPLTGAVIQNGSYTIQQGDTLGALATRFATTVGALLAANADVVGMLPIGATIHLAGITGYFGVSLADLFEVPAGADPAGDIARSVAANQASKSLLTPLIAVVLPSLTYTIKSGDTPLSVARHYNLTIEQLVGQNQGPGARFGTILIPNCGQLPLATLLSRLAQSGAFNRAAGVVARFLLHGLRLPDKAPDPAEILSTLGDGRIDLAGKPLFPLYRLVGQQWTPPARPAASYGVTLALSDSSAGWLKLGSGDSSAPLKVGLHKEDIAKIAAMSDRLSKSAQPFDPGILALTEYPPYRVVPKRFAFGQPVLWQTPVAPIFGQGMPPTAGMPQIYPFTSALRGQLAATPASDADLRMTVGTRTAAGELPAATTAITGFGWATRLDFVIRQAPDPDQPGQFIPAVYELYSTDQNGRHDLLALVEYLRAGTHDVQIDLLYAADPVGGGQGLRSDVVDATTVVLLKTNLSTLTHSPQVRALTLALAEELPAASPYDASLAQPLQFLTLLWEGSVVNSGGYYLFYRNSDGEGLPAQLFNQTPTATLTALVTIRAAQGSPTTIAARPFHNCAICSENLDPANAVVFAEPPLYTVAAGDTLQTIAARMGTADQLGLANATVEHLLQPGHTIALPGAKSYTVQLGDDLLSVALALNAPLADVIDAVAATPNLLLPGAQMYTHPAWIVRRATIAPGRAGFRLVRSDPTAAPGADATAANLASLYHLLGFSLRAQGGFRASAEGLPAGPAESRGEAINSPPSGAAWPWVYQRTLAIAHLAEPAALPQPAEWQLPIQNRYAGIGASAAINFQYHDIYGNRCLPDSAVPNLPIGIRYRDPILGLNQWPAVVASYDVDPPSTSAPASLRLRLGFDATRYLPVAGDTLDTAKQRAAADQGSVIPDAPRALSARAQYEQIYSQIDQQGIAFALTTTLDQVQDHPLDQPAFRDFVVAAYNYLSAVGALRQVTAQIGPNDTLGGIAAAYHITAGALAAANQETAGILAPNAELTIPLMYVVVQSDTLASIAQIAIQKHVRSAPNATTQIVARQVAVANQKIPLQARTTISVNGAAYSVVSSDTLASIASAQHIAIEQLADANRDVANLFAPGTQLALGTALGTAAVGDTLALIARNNGLSIAALAEANASRPGLLAPGGTLAIAGQLVCTDIYTVVAGDTLAGIATRGGVTVEALLAANQDQPHLLVAGAPVTLAGMTVHPPIVVQAGETLAALLARIPAPGLAAATIATNLKPGLLQPGAVLRIPFAALQIVQAGGALAGIAGARVSPAALASANQNLAGLLAVGASVALAGVTLDPPVAVEANDTLATLLARVQAQTAGQSITLADLAALPGLLSPGAKLMLPPQAIEQAVGIIPSFTDLTVPLSVEVSIQRPAELVDPELRDEPGVRVVSTSVRPNLGVADQLNSGQAAQDLGLRQFAARFERAFPTLKLATGAYSGGAAAAAGALMAVQFQNATLRYTIAPSPAFFAPRPLSTSRWTGAQVPIFTYRSGVPQDEFERSNRNFSDVDLDTWGRDFLNAVDRFLSSEYAAAAYQLDPISYRAVVRAKDMLAAAIRDMVEPILDPAEAGQGMGDLLAARELLYEHLRIRLSTAYTIDTIVQFPASVTSPSQDAKTAPRLAGKLVGAPYRIPAGATLQSVADAFGAPLDLLAATIADHPLILTTGFSIVYGDASYIVRDGDTLFSIAASLSQQPAPVTAIALARALAQVAGLLRADAGLNLIRRSYTQVAYDTLAAVLARFQQLVVPSLTLADLAAANQSQAGLLRPGATLSITPGRTYTIAQGDTLAGIARAQGLSLSDLVAANKDAPGLLMSDPPATLQYTLSASVQAGDTLAAVLARFQSQLVAPALTLADLAAANQSQAGLLRPGATLSITPTSTYTVVQGDTLADIAQAQGVSLAALAAANKDAPGLLAGGATLHYTIGVTVRPRATLRMVINYLTPRIASARGLQDALANLAAMNPEMAASFSEAQLDSSDLLDPGVTISFLSRIPGYSLSEAKLSLADSATSPLTFFFQTSSDDQNSNIALQIAYQINELEYNIGYVDFADGYQSSDWLSFIQPAIDDSIGVVDIPIPLRAYPIPPSIERQAIVQTLPDSPTLKDLRTYSYQFTYIYHPADQDRLIDGVRYNVADTGPAEQDVASADQLAYALAQYASIAVPLNQDLAALTSLRPAGNDPGLEQVARGAVQVFAQLVARIARAWQSETALPATKPAAPVYDDRRVGMSDGPDRQTIDFPNIDAIVQQNAWGGVRVTRNENILIGCKTAGFFVYQTKDIRSSSKAAPLFTYRKPFDLASIPLRAGQLPTLAQRLINLFSELLDTAPGSAPVVDCAVRVAASFGFLLAGTATSSAGAAPSSILDPNITTLVPVLVKPHTLFTKADLEPGGLCDQLATALNLWRDQNKVARDRSMWVFDVSVYTTIGGDAAAATPPLLELTNLRLALADAM